MNKTVKGIIFGIIAGIIDLIPMIFQKLSMDANLSAFSLWIISGYLIANTQIGLKGVAKGILISFLVLIPSAILIGWKEPTSLVPISFMTIILGGLLGYFIDSNK